MNLDEIDIKILKENFDESLIRQIDSENVLKILKYLENNGIYYAKDLFLTSLDLFLYPLDDFIRKFEILKEKLGDDFANKLGEDSSLIEYMYSE
ncbi:MAG: hypothetical protein E7158_03665 [Firmicutes bacterium]|nr:hypothetical protein [Bacillota bacterium]